MYSLIIKEIKIMKAPAIFSSLCKRTVNISRRINTYQIAGYANDGTTFCNKVIQKENPARLLVFDKKLINQLSKKVIEHLEGLPIDDFLNESQSIILKVLNIPEDLSPLFKKKVLSTNEAMCYEPVSNYICINPPTLDKSRRKIFGFLRHEMEHFRQNALIIRTENLGEHAIESYSRFSAKEAITKFINTYKDMPQSDIQKLKEEGFLTEPNILLINKIKKTIEKDDGSIIKLTETLTNNTFKQVHRNWQNIRNLLIEKCGIISESSDEGFKAAKYYEGFLNANEAGSIQYFKSEHEKEAFSEGYGASLVYLFKKILG